MATDIRETADAELLAGAERAKPGLGATTIEPALEGLDRIANRCEDLGHVIDRDDSVVSGVASCSDPPADMFEAVRSGIVGGVT
ncbi:MAG: hypothetical protein ACRD1T_23635, partial [Acidimicrobiia bacterium]